MIQNIVILPSNTMTLPDGDASSQRGSLGASGSMARDQGSYQACSQIPAREDPLAPAL